MKKYSFLLFALMSLSSFLTAQTLVERGRFSFDDCSTNSFVGSNFPFFIPSGEEKCACGVVNEALALDGVDDELLLSGDIDNLFTKLDFTISFYFKVFDLNENIPMTILSNQDSCTNENIFSVTYRPSSKIMNVTLVENNTNIGSVLDTIPGDNCWNHIVITRDNDLTSLYANGEFLTSKKSTSGDRVDLEQDDNTFRVGNSTCPNDFRFQGWIDELVFYQNSMSAERVKDIYLYPNKIGNGPVFLDRRDTTIFLGDSMEGFITSKCDSTEVVWTPDNEILFGTEDTANAILAPTESTLYTVTFFDTTYLEIGGIEESSVCVSQDQFFVEIIDPSDLECTELFVPSAFTPNGDNLNETFFISNAVVMTEMYSFEIFDRWGNIVFATDDPNGVWDGNYSGTPVNSNTFVYKIAYRCKDENLFKTGTVTVMR